MSQGFDPTQSHQHNQPSLYHSQTGYHHSYTPFSQGLLENTKRLSIEAKGSYLHLNLGEDGANKLERHKEDMFDEASIRNSKTRKACYSKMLQILQRQQQNLLTRQRYLAQQETRLDKLNFQIQKRISSFHSPLQSITYTCQNQIQPKENEAIKLHPFSQKQLSSAQLSNQNRRRME